MERRGFNKKGMEGDYLIWLIIGAVILAIGLVSVMIMSGKGIGALDFIKDIFRFGS
ncbi:hypothetical protein HOE04_05530 [archaeon]|jgi:hypothetical protein|nr:hypothetical protein [archaeon]